MTWSDEDIKLVEKFIMIKNNGYYASGQEVTNVYNRILGKNEVQPIAQAALEVAYLNWKLH